MEKTKWVPELKDNNTDKIKDTEWILKTKLFINPDVVCSDKSKRVC